MPSASDLRGALLDLAGIVVLFGIIAWFLVWETKMDDEALSIARDGLAPYFVTDGEEEDPEIAAAVEGALGRLASLIAAAITAAERRGWERACEAAKQAVIAEEVAVGMSGDGNNRAVGWLARPRIRALAERGPK